jgi:uncharacterized membrane protein
MGKSLYKLLTLFSIGGSAYVLIELLFRGFSHWTMFILGGICFVFLGLINESFSWEMPLWKQCLLGSGFITLLELFFGITFNLILKMNIWDYSNMPCNYLGQICLPFTIAWFFLSAISIILDDWIRYFLFKEEKPHDKLK